MRLSAISFGNQQRVIQNDEAVKNEALCRLWQYWEKTGDFRPARIDLYTDNSAVITLIGDPQKTTGAKSTKSSLLSRFIKMLGKIFNRIPKKG